MPRLSKLAMLALMLSVVPSSFAQTGGDALEQGFKTPPASAKPRTWWHWTSGNVTKEGITKDLEWMKRVGIAGFMMAEVGNGGGQVIDNPVQFGTPEWLEMLRHAAAEADRLGLEMSVFSSPGWSETGGPWVTPEEGMKRLVWTETTIQGPKAFNAKLEQAPANLDFYKDASVLAFPAPAGDSDLADLKPTMTSSGGELDGSAIADGSLQTNSAVAIEGPGRAAWLQYEFKEPVSIRAFTISVRAGNRTGAPTGRLVAGNDARTMQPIVALPGTQLYRQGSVRTFSFEPVSARIWRLEMTGAPLDPAATMRNAAPLAVDSYQVQEARLHSAARVNRWEEKSGGSQFLFEYESSPTPPVEAAAAVDRGRIVDLTSKMSSDGTLNWDAPAGKWTILRMGYVPTGARNRPATGAGSGLEADKLSGKHMTSYHKGYFGPIKQALGDLYGKSLRYVMMDSWEAGMQNWTDAMAAEFKTRRGYDPAPWLPALTGRVVESAEASDRFLWDFRRTLADMWAEYHYGLMAGILKKEGLGVYAEAAGVSLEIPEDTLLNKRDVEIPMGEFWVRDLHPRLMYLQDVRSAASAAHAYGKPIAAAESFTGGGYESPFNLKKVGDYWIAQGINRVVFHTSAHQPLDTKPGNTMVGTHINRNITWAEQAGPFMDYIARGSYMLQQGKFVGDLAYLLDEGAPSTPPIWGDGTQPAPPKGYDFDFVNADILLNRMSVGADGRILLPDGMSYRGLVMPETRTMRPELLAKIKELAEGGALIYGPRPLKSPSLQGQPQADAKVQDLAQQIWGDLDGVSRLINRVGKGTVVWGMPLDETLRAIVPPDFEYGGGLDAEVAWIHRRSDAADIYYVANLTDAPQKLQARFRVDGKEAEIWHPDSGLTEPASYEIKDGRTIVPLDLDQRELVFVVFRKTAAAPSRALPELAERSIATIAGPWQVRFQPNLGAPEGTELAELASWTDNTENGIKYFSGTATYQTTFRVASAPEGGRVLIDLGDVGDIAEVSVNGKSLGMAWKPPYRFDATDAVQTPQGILGRTQANTLEVKVTNEWNNRIAGDAAATTGTRVLSQAPRRGGRGGGARRGGGPAPLPRSGLLGPVQVIAQNQ